MGLHCCQSCFHGKCRNTFWKSESRFQCIIDFISCFCAEVTSFPSWVPSLLFCSYSDVHVLLTSILFVQFLKGNGICVFRSLPFWNQCMFHFLVKVKAWFKDLLCVVAVSSLLSVQPALCLCAVQSCVTFFVKFILVKFFWCACVCMKSNFFLQGVRKWR